MGRALIQGMLACRFVPGRRILGWDPDSAKLRGLVRSCRIRPARSNRKLAEGSDVILLAVKPQQMGAVLEEIRPHLRHRPLVISIAAGVRIGRIEKALGDRVPVVRVMPNSPALIGRGISAVAAGRAAGRQHLAVAEALFRGVGRVVRVPERWMDAVTAVSGSGPAYFFFLMEEMIRAGVGLGLSPSAARELVLSTAEGAAALARSEPDPAALRARVTSRGGTTEAAFRCFTRAGLGRILGAGIRAAARRSKALSR